MGGTDHDESIGNGHVSVSNWVQRFNKILTPIDRFVNRTTLRGLILMASAFIDLMLESSPYPKTQR